MTKKKKKETEIVDETIPELIPEAETIEEIIEKISEESSLEQLTLDLFLVNVLMATHGRDKFISGMKQIASNFNVTKEHCLEMKEMAKKLIENENILLSCQKIHQKYLSDKK